MTDDEKEMGPCVCCGEPGCIQDVRGVVSCLACAVVELSTNHIGCLPGNRHCPKLRKEST